MPMKRLNTSSKRMMIEIYNNNLINKTKKNNLNKIKMMSKNLLLNHRIMMKSNKKLIKMINKIQIKKMRLMNKKNMKRSMRNKYKMRKWKRQKKHDDDI